MFAHYGLERTNETIEVDRFGLILLEKRLVEFFGIHLSWYSECWLAGKDFSYPFCLPRKGMTALEAASCNAFLGALTTFDANMVEDIEVMVVLVL